MFLLARVYISVQLELIFFFCENDTYVLLFSDYQVSST